MITEDQDVVGVNNSRTSSASAQFIRALPSISLHYTNPKAVALKAEFTKEISVLATPKDDPVYIELLTKYGGAILYDNETRASQKLFRVVAIQYVQSYTAGRYSCWEATCEPIFRDSATGKFVVPDELMVEGSNVIQTNALVGYAVVEYQNGNDGDPTYLPWLQNYIDHFRNVIEPRYKTLDVRDLPSCPRGTAKDLPSVSKKLRKDLPSCARGTAKDLPSLSKMPRKPSHFKISSRTSR